MCDNNRDPLNGIIDSKDFVLSMLQITINVYYLLDFLGAMLSICMVTITINNISNLSYAVLSEYTGGSLLYLYLFILLYCVHI